MSFGANNIPGVLVNPICFLFFLFLVFFEVKRYLLSVVFHVLLKLWVKKEFFALFNFFSNCLMNDWAALRDNIQFEAWVIEIIMACLVYIWRLVHYILLNSRWLTWGLKLRIILRGFLAEGYLRFSIFSLLWLFIYHRRLTLNNR